MSLEIAWGMYQWKVIPEENLAMINVLEPRSIPKSFPVKIVLYRNLVIDLYRLVYLMDFLAKENYGWNLEN